MSLILLNVIAFLPYAYVVLEGNVIYGSTLSSVAPNWTECTSTVNWSRMELTTSLSNPVNPCSDQLLYSRRKMWRRC